MTLRKLMSIYLRSRMMGFGMIGNSFFFFSIYLHQEYILYYLDSLLLFF